MPTDINDPRRYCESKNMAHMYIFYLSVTRCILRKSTDNDSPMMAQNVSRNMYEYRMNICNWHAVVGINNLIYILTLFLNFLLYVIYSLIGLYLCYRPVSIIMC